ncbi:MAG: GNAT family N-acetyltransferase, partial [Dehalococcoidia bacterium]|nr:GNAT family N-acetyltransferase [Dehalococcoidia bacterium]
PAPRAGFLPTLRAYSGRVIHKRRRWQPPQALAWMNSLEVRLAQRAAEVRRAQKLRYRVFYKEGHAIADAKTKLARRDVDAFDALCDHLLVVDHAVLENYYDRKLPVPKTGPIQLQTHGGEIRWRNIFLREIPPDEADLCINSCMETASGL